MKGKQARTRGAHRARARPHPRMVNLTTASLEPAPLSSGWKSGSLPTGFTPTILSPAGRPRRHRLQNCRRRPGRGRAGGSGRPRPDHRRWRPRRLPRDSQCRVTPGSRAAGVGGVGMGRGEGRGEGRKGVRHPAATARQGRRRLRT